MRVIHDHYANSTCMGAVLDIATGPSVTIWDGTSWVAALPEGRRGVVPYENVPQDKVDSWIRVRALASGKKRGLFVLMGEPWEDPYKPTPEQEAEWERNLASLPAFARAFMASSSTDHRPYRGNLGLYHDNRYEIYRGGFERIWEGVPSQVAVS